MEWQNISGEKKTEVHEKLEKVKDSALNVIKDLRSHREDLMKIYENKKKELEEQRNGQMG